MQPQDITRETGRDRLSFIAAGRANEDVHELLASSRAREFVDTVSLKGSRKRNRIVVIDSPPLLPTTEAQVLSALAGMVVMVVNSQTTSPDAVTKALAQIPAEKAVNYVLNRAAESLLTGYQGGYYGYGSEADRAQES
jgi:protein-tyrosine kinase